MRGERGQAIVLIAIVMSALLLGVGLAVDTGELYVTRRGAQLAADAAAWGGAVVLNNGGTAAAASAAATTDAGRNGFTSGGGTTVTVSVPPASGSYAGDGSFVEVGITRSVGGWFFAGTRTVSVRGVAGATRSGAGHAVLALRSTGSDALTVGSGTLTVTGNSGIHVNSNHGSAINIGSGGIVSPYTRVRGGVAPGDAGKIAPAATTGAGLVADPYGTLPGPDTSSLVLRATNLSLDSGTTTLQPGIYNGGIRVRNSAVAVLAPGVYVLRGGGTSYGLTLANSGQIQMQGATGGVLIYNTHSAYPAAPGGSPTCGPVDLNTNGQVTLRPQGLGSYAGVSVFQDRACTGTMQFRGGGAWTLNGTIYLPSATFSLGGSSGVAQNIQVIANVVALSGAASITIAYAGSNVGGSRVPALVE
ncbi:MAG TPA: pilus assembly protein TadG-related protein [Candidatus Limnocylindria bacterium]|nr:pilus assembly protein TadG-related protein [Candidatus Limnocylindria bacterium]